MKSAEILFGSDSKLRSGWRFTIFILGFIFVGLVIGTAVVAAVVGISKETAPGTSTFFVVNGLVSLFVALLVGWLCGKYLEGLPFTALGAGFLKGWWLRFVFGLLIGALTFSLAAMVGIATGGLSFQLNADAARSSILTTLVFSFLIFAAAAAFEEALFRGYILQTFIRSEMTWFGVLLTSTLFATVHNANPSANLFSWLNTFIAGIWFSVAYLRSRDLWLPFGLHLAWNWTQGSIFGVEVSGITEIVKAPIMRETDTGPAWITGGDYGIEGGVITTIALIVSAAAIYFIPFSGRISVSTDHKVGAAPTSSGS